MYVFQHVEPHGFRPTLRYPRDKDCSYFVCFELVSSGFRLFIGSYELSRSTSFGGSDLADAVPGGVLCRTRFRGEEPSDETDLRFIAFCNLGGAIEVLLDDSRTAVLSGQAVFGTAPCSARRR